MESRTLENLILKNKDYIYDGDLTINGKVQITNGSIIVSGNLFFTALHSDLIHIINGNIIAHSLKSRAHSMRIYNGNIVVKNNADIHHVSCEGDVKIDGSCSACNVDCHNYLISGDNDSDDVTARETIYILGYNYSGDLKAKEIFINGFCRFAPYGKITVTAKHFECGGPIEKCRGMIIG